MESKRLSDLTRLMVQLREPRTQVQVLGGLVGLLVLIILVLDLAKGGEAKPPPALGAAIQATPGTRVVVVPTLSPIETPTAVPAASSTPSSAADALARDTQRLEELALLKTALAEYRDRFDEYPDTSGNVQTMCNYKEVDAGCDLEEVLNDDELGILEDPLGAPLDNGYWYASDGDSYTIWMLREGPGNPGDPVCPEVTPHLEDKASLFCVSEGTPNP